MTASKRYSQAEVTQQITEVNARSGKFLILLNSSSGLAAQPTLSAIAAVEIATDTTGYPTRPAVTFGTPIVTSGVSITASQTFTISTTASMTFDGYAIVYGGSSTRGDTTGSILMIDNTIGTTTIPAGQSGNLTVNLTKKFDLT